MHTAMHTVHMFISFNANYLFTISKLERVSRHNCQRTVHITHIKEGDIRCMQELVRKISAKAENGRIVLRCSNEMVVYVDN